MGIKLFPLLLGLVFVQFAYGQHPNSPTYTYRYKSGELAAAYYFRTYTTNSKPHWYVRVFNKNGSLRKEFDLIEDTVQILFNSITYQYYRNGQLSSKFIAGQKSYDGAADFYRGYLIFYSKNGQKEREGLAVLGKGNIGLWKYYYPNGTLKKRGFWLGYKRIGPWEFYNELGKLTKRKHFG